MKPYPYDRFPCLKRLMSLEEGLGINQVSHRKLVFIYVVTAINAEFLNTARAKKRTMAGGGRGVGL